MNTLLGYNITFSFILLSQEEELCKLQHEIKNTMGTVNSEPKLEEKKPSTTDPEYGTGFVQIDTCSDDDRLVVIKYRFNWDYWLTVVSCDDHFIVYVLLIVVHVLYLVIYGYRTWYCGVCSFFFLYKKIIEVAYDNFFDLK